MNSMAPSVIFPLLRQKPKVVKTDFLSSLEQLLTPYGFLSSLSVAYGPNICKGWICGLLLSVRPSNLGQLQLLSLSLPDLLIRLPPGWRPQPAKKLLRSCGGPCRIGAQPSPVFGWLVASRATVPRMRASSSSSLLKASLSVLVARMCFGTRGA